MRRSVLRKLDFSGPLEAAAYFLLIGFAAAAPLVHALAESARLAIGGGAPPAQEGYLLASCAFTIAATTFLSGFRSHSLRLAAVPLAAAGLLALLGLVQLLPVPETVLARIAPVNLRIYHETAQIMDVFVREGAPDARISIAPSETLYVVLLVLSYAAIFVAAVQLMTNRPRRRFFAAALCASALLHVVLGVLRAGSLEERLRGAFGNPNHFGAYLGILLAIAFAVLWTEILRDSDASGSPDPGVGMERRLLRLGARFLVWAGILAGILLTRSRGAILAAAATTVVLLALGTRHRRARSRRPALAAAGTAGILVIGIVAAGGLLLRFNDADPRDLGSDTRLRLWETSLQAWRQFPVVGSGLGAFPEAFRRVQPRELNFLVEHAHSDPLQLLVTGGSIGAALGALLFVSLFVLLLRAWRRQKHREESAFVLAGIGALLSVALHGLVEFNLSIPVIPATLACVLGAAWAAAPDR